MYVTLTRKSVAVILGAVIISLILLGQIFSINAGGIDGSTNEKRLQYLNGLGISVNETATNLKTVKIPQEFSDVYKKYNSLQQKAGFDLANYKGKTVEIYTYLCQDQPQKEVHLMVYKGNVIGGDVSETMINGQMTALKRNDK